MCHMIADSLEELHAMADKIGIQRKWFQSNSRFPHYDICAAKRRLAVKEGAIESSLREMVTVMKRFRLQEIEQETLSGKAARENG